MYSFYKKSIYLGRVEDVHIWYSLTVHTETVNTLVPDSRGSSLHRPKISPIILIQTFIPKCCWNHVSWKERGLSSAHVCCCQYLPLNSILHPSAAQILNATAVVRIFFNAHNPVMVANLDITASYPHHCLVWNVMADQTHGSTIRSSFYGTHLPHQDSCEFLVYLHLSFWLHSTCFLQMTCQRNENPAIWILLLTTSTSKHPDFSMWTISPDDSIGRNRLN
jgi:hypothetical protein